MPSTVEKSLTSNNPNLSPLAGKPAPKEMLIDVARLERDYFERKPDLEDANQLVSLAPADTAVRHSTAPLRKPAYCDHTSDLRLPPGSKGPTGRSTLGKTRMRLLVQHRRTALEVLGANNVETVIQESDRVTPTPVIASDSRLQPRSQQGIRRRHCDHAFP